MCSPSHNCYNKILVKCLIRFSIQLCYNKKNSKFKPTNQLFLYRNITNIICIYLIKSEFDMVVLLLYLFLELFAFITLFTTFQLLLYSLIQMLVQNQYSNIVEIIWKSSNRKCSKPHFVMTLKKIKKRQKYIYGRYPFDIILHIYYLDCEMPYVIFSVISANLSFIRQPSTLTRHI